MSKPIKLYRTARLAQPRRPIGIVEALRTDHDAARGLIAKINADPTTRQTLYPQLADALRRHDDAESETLYQALMRRPFYRAQMGKSRLEHERIAAALRQLDLTSMHSPVWNSRFAAMHRALEMHLGVEETRVFEWARQLPMAEQVQLAAAYHRLKSTRQVPGRMQGQSARRIQPSMWDQIFGVGGAKNLVMNPAMRQILGPPLPRQAGDTLVRIEGIQGESSRAGRCLPCEQARDEIRGERRRRLSTKPSRRNTIAGDFEAT